MCNVHGLACWFDVLFDGSVQPRWLSTAPGQPTTHWSVLLQPCSSLGSAAPTPCMHVQLRAAQSGECCGKHGQNSSTAKDSNAMAASGMQSIASRCALGKHALEPESACSMWCSCSCHVIVVPCGTAAARCQVRPSILIMSCPRAMCHKPVSPSRHHRSSSCLRRSSSILPVQWQHY